MSSGSQKRTAISRLSKNRRSLFRKIEVEDHQSVGAAFERGDQPGAGALMRFMHRDRRRGRRHREIDGEATDCRPRAKGSGLTLALKWTLSMPSVTCRSASEIGMDCRALNVGDIVAKPDEKHSA